MGDERLPSGRSSALSVALSRLAADQGVWSNDLVERLSPELRDYWGIDQNERDVVTLHKHVVANLRKHISELRPASAGRAVAYVRSVQVSFNVYDKVDLRDTNPTARREWIKDQVDEKFRASEKSSRDWLVHAIGQIERSLVDGDYKPVLPEEFPRFGLSLSNSQASTPQPQTIPDEQRFPANDSVRTSSASGQTSELRGDWQINFYLNEQRLDDQPLPKDSELPPPSSPSRFRSWKRPVVLICIAAIVLTASAIGLVLFNSGTAHADCGATAKALEIKQPYGITDSSSGWSVAYPADRSDSARESLTRIDRMKTHPEDYDQFLNEELDAGAYLYGGMKLHLEFVSLDEREVIIRDIRPIIHERPNIPVEAVIFAPTQGGGVTQAYFVLDDVRPAARIGNLSEKANGEDPLLFDVKRFGISQGQDPEEFTLEFQARYSAFIFDVAVDYEVGGVTCTRIINRNGRPFQVTTGACPVLFVSDKNRDRDLRPLKALRYKAIRDTVVDTADNKFVFAPLDPEVFASRCGGT